MINTALNDNLNFNVVRDIAAIATVTLTPYALVVNPAFTAKAVPDLIEYAKGDPGKVNMASGGNGSVSHVAGELFKQMTGVDVVHVPYRGSTPAHMDLIGGQVQVMFDAMTTSLDHIKSGRLRVLAVTSTKRSALLPNVPTVGDFVSGYDVTAWLGVGAPANTPIQVVELLDKEISLALADPEFGPGLSSWAAAFSQRHLANLRRLIADDAKKWRRVVHLCRPQTSVTVRRGGPDTCLDPCCAQNDLICVRCSSTLPPRRPAGIARAPGRPSQQQKQPKAGFA